MRTHAAAVLIAFASLVVPSCGKKGAILPPLVLVPQPAEAVKAFQRGSRIILEWTLPSAYIDGRALGKIAAVEVWLEERSAAAPAPAGDFAFRARRVAAVPPDAAAKTKAMSYAYVLGPGATAGKTLVFRLRVQDAEKKRLSDFSDEVTVKPQPLPLPPSAVAAEVFVDRVEIRWTAPAANFDGSSPAAVQGYHVYRIEKSGQAVRLTSLPKAGGSFSDTAFEFKQSYRYFVRAAASKAEPYLESDDSSVVEVIPRDVFPPAPPSGVMSAQGPDFITLVWDANKEADFSGYKVWRRAGGQPEFVCLTPTPILETTYADRAVEKGRWYEYAISAVDTAGNESLRSAAVRDIIKDARI